MGPAEIYTASRTRLMGLAPSLTADQRYLLVGLLKQGGGDVYLNVGARRQSGPTPAAQVPVLSGDRR